MAVSSSQQRGFSGQRALARSRMFVVARIALVGVTLISCISIFASQGRAQDQSAGETARQERARKQKEAKRSKHVYTDEDLKRSQILTEEDRERMEASRNNAAPAPAENAQARPADPSQPAQLSLGEIARQYRRQKQARQAEESARLKYEMKTPSSLASPAPPNAPLAPPVVSKPAPRPAPRATPAAPFKLRSPFERPPLRPEVPLRAVRPALAPEPSRRPAPQPVQPSVTPSSRPFQRITVQSGDSLWRLAKQNLGRGSRWPELLALNPRILDPNHIGAGTQIYLPLASNASRAPLKIQVRAGDTLWGIARAQFGRGALWGCIASVNPQIQDASHILPGQILTLPSGCKTKSAIPAR